MKDGTGKLRQGNIYEVYCINLIFVHVLRRFLFFAFLSPPPPDDIHSSASPEQALMDCAVVIGCTTIFAKNPYRSPDLDSISHRFTRRTLAVIYINTILKKHVTLPIRMKTKNEDKKKKKKSKKD